MWNFEKAATEYAEEHWVENSLVVTNEPWPKAREIFAKAFEDGARFAIEHLWVSVDERLPEHGDTVLIREYFRSPKWGIFDNRVREFYYHNKWGFDREEELQSRRMGKYRITHWMPIPKLPAKRKI